MPCCSGTKKMLISGYERVCRTACVYPLRVRWLWPRAGGGGRGVFLCPILNALRCALCVSTGMLERPVCCAWRCCADPLPPVSHIGACGWAAAVTHTIVPGRWCALQRWEKGGGGLKAGRHHATAAWISNTHTFAEPGTRVLSPEVNVVEWNPAVNMCERVPHYCRGSPRVRTHSFMFNVELYSYYNVMIWEWNRSNH